MQMLDLFSGIGCFSLAALWTGQIKTVQFVEIDPFCQKVLKKNFPGVPIHDMISINARAEAKAKEIKAKIAKKAGNIGGNKWNT